MCRVRLLSAIPLVTALAAGAPLAPAGAQFPSTPVPLVNPSFEAGLTGWNPEAYFGGSVSATTACEAPDGLTCAALAITPAFLSQTRISQAFTALAGHAYTFRANYRFASLPAFDRATLFVNVPGVVFDAFTTDLPRATNCVAVWCELELSYQIQGPETPFPSVVQFSYVGFNGSAGASTLWIDDVRLSVSVAVIPEPQTAALLGTGLLVLGAAARRRTRAD